MEYPNSCLLQRSRGVEQLSAEDGAAISSPFPHNMTSSFFFLSPPLAVVSGIRLRFFTRRSSCRGIVYLLVRSLFSLSLLFYILRFFLYAGQLQAHPSLFSTGKHCPDLSFFSHAELLILILMGKINILSFLPGDRSIQPNSFPDFFPPSDLLGIPFFRPGDSFFCFSNEKGVNSNVPTNACS